MTNLDQTHEFPIGGMKGGSKDAAPAEEPDLRYRMLIDSMRDIIFKLDRKANITFVNQGALDFTGYIEEEMLGMNIADVLPPEDLERFKKMFQRSAVVGRREFYMPESKLINRELGLTPIEINVLIMGSDEETTDILFVARDMTLRKKVERERLRRQKYELLSMLSHGFFQEIDATLTEIAEEIQFVSDNLDPACTAYRRLGGAVKTCEKGRNLVEEMLGISEPEMAKRRSVSIQEILQASAASVSFEGRIEIETPSDEALWSVVCDEARLTRAFRHLILNAVEAGFSKEKPDGKIGIRAENLNLEDGAERTGLFIPAGEYVRITVQDHGHGIPDEYLDRIFDPFFSTKGDVDSRSRGLGLTQVYAIVKGHRGYIDVLSKPDIRTLFSVYLPAFRKETNEKTETSPSSAVGRILVMDDEEIVRKVAGQMLRGLGYQVAFAVTGEEAVALYSASLESERFFDAVILDLNVKDGMGGKAAMAELLKIDPNVKGIISSGYSSDPEMMDYGRCGFKAVVGKPYHISDLRRVLKDILGEYPY